MHPWAPIWLTADNPAIQGPVEIAAIFVTPTAGAVADVTFRHGLSTGDRTAFVVRTASGESLPVVFPAPILFDRGLFADLGSNVTGVLVIWRPYVPPQLTPAPPLVVEVEAGIT